MNFIVDKTMPNFMIDKLRCYGTIYKSTTIITEDEAISTHPDLQIHFVADTIAFCPPATIEYYEKILPSHINLHIGTVNPGSTYPSVCAYNIARVGEHILCNTKIADTKILKYYEENNYKIIHVNQGYTKCNVCPISDSVFLTEDQGIFNSVKSEPALTAYLLEKGEVSLNGFDYGFIGGATGKIGNNTLVCCGKLIANKEKILKLLSALNMQLLELSYRSIYDYGSILSFV